MVDIFIAVKKYLGYWFSFDSKLHFHHFILIDRGGLFIILHSRFEWRFILVLRVIGIIIIILIFEL